MTHYIFRHGETYFSKNDITYSKYLYSAEILPESISATEKIAEFLKEKNINKAYTSPFKRAIQTAKIITRKAKIKFETDKRIGEELINYGKETFEEFEARISGFVNELKSQKFQNIAICSHGWPIAALIALIIKDNLKKGDLGSYPKCGELIIIKNKLVEKIDFNS